MAIKFSRYDLCVFDLVTDTKSGKLSVTKLWFHVANVIMSYNIATDHSADWLKFLAYGATVGGSMAAVQLIKWRFNANPNSDVSETN